jgi:DNA repair exonuclease SbcCD ATPase subunit
MHARRLPQLVPLLVLTGLTGLTGSCRSAYYGLWETLGVEKREIMVDRVEDAREAQADAKDQFVSALDRFRTVVEIEPSELESVYADLADELESSEERASAVQSRVASVEEVAGDLFEEWEAELDEYKDPDLARSSAELLEKTRDQYDGLIGAMRKASDSMTPVLDTFRDQVRFLKHNLNAEAIASLQGELGSIESSTAALVRDMEAAIAEADAFIAGMRKSG